MATALARISRKTLSAISPNCRLLNRAFSAEASAKSITPSPDRVKWDYRGQRQIIPLGQWLPKGVSQIDYAVAGSPLYIQRKRVRTVLNVNCDTQAFRSQSRYLGKHYLGKCPSFTWL